MTRPSETVVDIVVNNYNYARYLPDAVASARAQTHPAVNVIVVDDGSTDDSRAVLADLQGDDLTVVLKENGGQASALNAGAARSTGDVVIFLDADDLLKPDAAARVAAAFAVSDPPARVQFRMDVIDAEGKPTGELKPFTHLSLPSGDLRAAELAYSFDLGWMPTSANAFRADALRRVLPIPEQAFRILSDWYLVHTTTLLGSILSLDDVLASYRVHGANNFERDDAELDLARLRKNLPIARATTVELARLATELGLSHPEPIESLADLGQRLISLRLEPDLHPFDDDRVGSVLVAAARTIPRRSDSSLAMKAIYAGWFAAMATAPRRLAVPLALYFLYPERRGALNNGLLGRLRHP